MIAFIELFPLVFVLLPDEFYFLVQLSVHLLELMLSGPLRWLRMGCLPLDGLVWTYLSLVVCRFSIQSLLGHWVSIDILRFGVGLVQLLLWQVAGVGCFVGSEERSGCAINALVVLRVLLLRILLPVVSLFGGQLVRFVRFSNPLRFLRVCGVWDEGAGFELRVVMRWAIG